MEKLLEEIKQLDACYRNVRISKKYNDQNSENRPFMNQFSRRMRWLAINGIFLVALYFGLIDQIQGARNVALFMAWYTGFMSICSLSQNAIDSLVEKGGFAMPSAIKHGFDLTVVLTLVWSGYFVTAAFYGLGALCIAAVRSKVDEKLKQPS